MGADAQTHFSRHDIVHVLFDLDTSIRQEAQADGWTLFGTTVGIRDIVDFMRLPEEKDLISEIGMKTILKGFLNAVIDYPRIAFRSRRLSKKWPWSGHEAFLDKKVGDIRREFGIDSAMASI